MWKLLKRIHRDSTLDRLDFTAEFGREVTDNDIEQMLQAKGGRMQGVSVNGLGWICLPNQTWMRLDAVVVLIKGSFEWMRAMN